MTARTPRHSRISIVILVVAAAVGAGMFVLSRTLNERASRHLLAFQAVDAKTSVTSLISQIESAMSSVGSVAASSDEDPVALDKLTTEIPSLEIFSTLSVLQLSSSGPPAVVEVRGNPAAPLGDLSTSSGNALARVLAKGGYQLFFFGHGAQRHLALSVGAPGVPAGYVVYAELPLPATVSISNVFPGLQFALYAGRTKASPLLFANTTKLPLSGQQVDQLVDLDNLSSTQVPNHGAQALLFVVSSIGSPLGLLPGLLPWILAAVVILLGLLVAFVVESTARRRDHALALAGDLAQKNAELDRAMTEQAEAEQTRLRLENELRQAQRLEAVGQLAGGVAHDFNNLLMVIAAHADFMAEELVEGHPFEEDLREVQNAARRAAELTRQLLVFSRRDLVEPSVLDVNTAISDVVNLLRRTVGEQVQLESILAPDLPRVLCDPGELQQVLVNLVVNARQAIDGDGTITIETCEQLMDEDAASAHFQLTPGHYVRIAVTDSGCGMAPETVSRVFEPYFTTKGPGSGTGLGLATVYGIVTRYGGYVTVYSEVGVGTTFKVYLPASDDEVEAATPVPSPEVSSLSHGTVLVVEDEDGVRTACRRILERAGFKVLEASNGNQALAQANGLKIDLLLTDVVMPGGISGRELAQRLEQHHQDLPVLFMSGYNADAIATRGVLDPGISVVEKPFSSTALLLKVHELLH